MKSKIHKCSIFAPLLALLLAQPSRGLQNAEQHTDRELDLFEGNVYIYTESCEKFASQPDSYHGPNLNKLLNDISIQRDHPNLSEAACC